MKIIKDYIQNIDHNECKNELIATLSQAITTISIGETENIKEIIPKLIFDLSIYGKLLEKVEDKEVENKGKTEDKQNSITESVVSEPTIHTETTQNHTKTDEEIELKRFVNDTTELNPTIISISEIPSYTIKVYDGLTYTINNDEYDKIGRILIPSTDEYNYWLKVYINEKDGVLYAERKEFEKEYPYIKAAYIRNYSEIGVDDKVKINQMFDSLIDLELLCNENKIAEYINNHIEFSARPKSEELLKLEGKRQSFIDNYNIRFIYNVNDAIYHDKCCDEVKYIKLDGIKGTENAPTGLVPCPKCYLDMLIRKGCKDDFKNIGLYRFFFNKGGITTKLLEEFFSYNNSSFRIETVNKMKITCKDDSWKIETDGRGNLVNLLHNNYTVDKKGVRHFDGSYHIQQSEMLMDVKMAFEYIMDYNFKNH